MGAPLPWPDRYLQPSHHPARDWGAWEVQAIPPEGLRSGAPATLSVEELHQSASTVSGTLGESPNLPQMGPLAIMRGQGGEAGACTLDALKPFP